MFGCAMAGALSVYVFQWDGTDIHALTLYRSGDNLPVETNESAWTYRVSLLMIPQSLQTLGLNAEVVVNELRARGFLITCLSSGIIALS
jgi:hypothetical protein